MPRDYKYKYEKGKGEDSDEEKADKNKGDENDDDDGKAENKGKGDRRHSSFVFTPASASFSTAMICSSVNRFAFMVHSRERNSTPGRY